MGLLALVALAVVVIDAIGASIDIRLIAVPTIIRELALAYLAAWIFYVLVEVLPRRKRETEVVRTLWGPIMLIANNGKSLFRDLEYIGRCPTMEITPEHVKKVLTANNNNEATIDFIAMRLSVAREAHGTVAPFLAMMPHDLALALQRVDQEFANELVNAHRRIDRGRYETPGIPEPSEMRRSVRVYTTAKVWGRATLIGFTGAFLNYFAATERVRQSASRFAPERGDRRDAELFEFFMIHKMNEPGYPFDEYPPAALSEEWIDT